MTSQSLSTAVQRKTPKYHFQYLPSVLSYYNKVFAPKVHKACNFSHFFGQKKSSALYHRMFSWDCFFQKTQIRGDVKKAIPPSVVGWVCWHVLVTVQYDTKAAAFVFLLSGKYGWPRTVTISMLWRRKGQLLTRYTRSMTAGFSFKYQSFYWRHVGKKQCPGNAHQIHWPDSSAWPHYHLSTYWPILTAWHWEALVT